jgi:outer membrane protein assembly factor BamD
MASMISCLQRFIVISTLVLMSACASTPDDADPVLPPTSPFAGSTNEPLGAREQRLTVDQLYRAARTSLDNGDFNTALTRYDRLIGEFPFSAYSTQASLEQIYALHRSFNPDTAIAAADRFVRDHPRHPANDYVQYLRGLINESRGDGFLSGLGYDSTQDDVSFARRAFDDYAVLIQRFPDSIYNGDARQRMVALRNRIAAHEMHALRFYMDRNAYLAAVNRAEHIVATYPGTPSVPEALALMERAQRTLGLTEQATATERLLRGNNLPTAADLGDAEVEQGWFARVGTRIGSWFGLSGGNAETDPTQGETS